MNTSHQDIIEKLTHLILDDSQTSSLTVSEITKSLGTSRTQLHRIVKKETGLSTTLYIRKIRLQKARELLCTSDLRISEIAHLSGIDSPQNFSKYFIQEFQLSPSEYRKLNSGQILHDIPPYEPVHQAESKDEWFRRLPSHRAFYIFLGVFVLIGIGAWIHRTQSTKLGIKGLDPGQNFENSLAILPFTYQNVAANSSEGILDELHNSLAQIENLKVIARTSSDQFKSTKNDFKKIGTELRVNHILTGNLQKQNNNLQLNLRLVDTQGDSTVWTKTYVSRESSLMRLTKAITRDIATELSQSISPSLAQRLNRQITTDQDAYNEFLEGRSLLVTREKEKLAQSIEKFNRAIALDSTFAEAYAYKAIAHNLNGNMGYTNLEASLNESEQNALMAIKLDGQNASAYAILGNIYREQYKWEQARTAYQISLKYKPNDAQTTYWYSLLLRSIGKPEEALEYSQVAIELDPLYPVILGGHIINCAYANRNDLAQKSVERGKILFGDSFVLYNTLGYYELINSNYAKALVHLRKAENMNPDIQLLGALIMFCEAKTGNTQKARNFISSLSDTPNDHMAKAIIYSALGNRDLSMHWLKKAADAGKIHYDLLLHPAFTEFHQDPRFLAILNQFDLRLP